MMEHYNTQATEVNHLWRQGLRKLALKQARAMDLSRPQAPDLGKTLHGMWQHLILQGWNQIFTPPPHQQDYSGAEAQQNPANEVPEKEIDDSESRAASVEVAENNQQTWEPFRKFSEEKRSEESHEKKQKDAHSISEAEEWERSSLLRNGTEITPEAPERLLGILERGPHQVGHHPQFFTENLGPFHEVVEHEASHKKEIFYPRKRCREKGTKEWRHRIPLTQEVKLGPWSSRIKILNEGRERPFGDEDWHKEAPVKSILKKEIKCLFGRREDRHSEGTSSIILDQMVEGSFKREDRCPEGNSIDTMHRLNKKGTGHKEKCFLVRIRELGQKLQPLSQEEEIELKAPCLIIGFSKYDLLREEKMKRWKFFFREITNSFRKTKRSDVLSCGNENKAQSAHPKIGYFEDDPLFKEIPSSERREKISGAS